MKHLVWILFHRITALFKSCPDLLDGWDVYELDDHGAPVLRRLFVHHYVWIYSNHSDNKWIVDFSGAAVESVYFFESLKRAVQFANKKYFRRKKYV